jgi:hypothetical protein
VIGAALSATPSEVLKKWAVVLGLLRFSPLVPALEGQGEKLYKDA